MTPVKMLYQETSFSAIIEVDLYHIYTDFQTFESLAICWVPSRECWMTTPIYDLKPIKKKEKLNG